MDRDFKVKWSGKNTFVGTSGSGHSMVIDGDKEIAMSPMELLLLSAGSCACIDLVKILEKARQKVMDVWVEVGGERRDELPKYYTNIELHFVVKGVGVKESHVKRAIDLAMEKYCSASAQLAALAEIKTSYEIIEADKP
jgi:putative redox protein